MSEQHRFVHNTIAHFDVAAPDLELVAPFYESLFGWEVARRGPGYASVTTPDGCPNGALVESQEPSLVIGIVVSDLHRALASAAELGGTVEMPYTDNGWVRKGQVRDPAGNLITLIQG